jgi:hypothetical protein
VRERRWKTPNTTLPAKIRLPMKKRERKVEANHHAISKA